MQVEKFYYDNKIVRNFAYATMLWGVVGMLAGLWAALQLVFPSFNVTQYGTFGRLRPLHTNAVIFAFVGNGIFMGVYYSLATSLKARMFSDKLSYIHFWGWQLIIVAAAITLPLGFTPRNRICRTDMANRYCHYNDLGSIWLEHVWYHY